MAEALEVAPEDLRLLQQTVRAAFVAWEDQAIHFPGSFDGPVVQATAIGPGFEIDLFAVPDRADVPACPHRRRARFDSFH